MGEFPPLSRSVIFPNRPSCSNYANEIRTYLNEEVIAGRMHGPFCREEMEDIMKRPFQSSPLIIDVQPQPDGVLDKLRMCRHLSKRDKLHPSTNDFVDTSKFPTHFGSVSEVAEIVSFLFPYLTLCASHFIPICALHTVPTRTSRVLPLPNALRTSYHTRFVYFTFTHPHPHYRPYPF